MLKIIDLLTTSRRSRSEIAQTLGLPEPAVARYVSQINKIVTQVSETYLKIRRQNSWRNGSPSYNTYYPERIKQYVEAAKTSSSVSRLQRIVPRQNDTIFYGLPESVKNYYENKLQAA